MLAPEVVNALRFCIGRRRVIATCSIRIPSSSSSTKSGRKIALLTMCSFSRPVGASVVCRRRRRERKKEADGCVPIATWITVARTLPPGSHLSLSNFFLFFFYFLRKKTLCKKQLLFLSNPPKSTIAMKPLFLFLATLLLHQNICNVVADRRDEGRFLSIFNSVHFK